MLIGEGPGDTEDKAGQPFVGMAGKEGDNYLILAGMHRTNCYITNLVRCRPPDNRDPEPDEIEACFPYLMDELAALNPEALIGCLGRFSSRAILGDPNLDLDSYHGLPFESDWGHTVVPMYHPAAGLHLTRMMLRILDDYKALGKIARGEIQVPKDGHPNPRYEWVEGELSLPIAPTYFIDTESDSDGTPWCLSISHKPGEGLVVPFSNEEAIATIQTAVSCPDVITVLHNILYDLPILQAAGIQPSELRCTMSMAYLLQDTAMGLKSLSKRLVGMDMRDYQEVLGPYTRDYAISYLEVAAEDDWEWPDPEPELVRKPDGSWHVKNPQKLATRIKAILRDLAAGKKLDPMDRWEKIGQRHIVEETIGPLRERSLREIPREEAVEYSGRDADATCRVYPHLWSRIRREGLEEVFHRDMRITPMVADMSVTGIMVDRDHFFKLKSELLTEMANIESRVESMMGKWYNLASAKHAEELLFKRLKLPPQKQSKKTGANSTDKTVIERLRGKHPVVDMIAEYRERDKIVDSFINVLLAMSAKDSIVRGQWSMTTVETGRLACRKPNLMAIPVRTALGRKLRDGFIARPGMVFLSSDYSQIEMRVTAHDSQDPLMMDIFWRKADIHSETASRMFGLPIDQLDEMKHRYPAKRVGFGILNYITAMGLQRELWVGGAGWFPESQCQEWIDSWFGIYSGVRAMMERYRLEARRFKKVWDMFGRYRLIPECYSVHPWIVEAGMRQAANAPIQMGAQGIIKEAMGQLVPIYRGYREEGVGVNPLLQIHDDLVWEIQEDMVEEVGEIKKTIMENAVSLSVPVAVDQKRGKRWGSLEKIKS